jgi:hypothetical protein
MPIAIALTPSAEMTTVLTMTVRPDQRNRSPRADSKLIYDTA